MPSAPTSTSTGVPAVAPSTGSTPNRSALPATTPPTLPSDGGPTASVTGRADRITLAFAGDVHFERGLSRLVTSPEPLTAAVRDTLGRADFAMVNLETAVGEGGAPLPGKKYTFRAPVAALTTLAAAGVDAVSMANNHAADFGDAVFAQTLDARRAAPLPVVGIGRDEAHAFAPLQLDVRGVRVAVLASSQIRDVTAAQHAAGPTSPGIATNLEPGRLLAAVRRARATSDLVVVMLHWGADYTRCADGAQRETARLLADAGADVIVGGHAHRPQGSGWLAPGGRASHGRPGPATNPATNPAANTATTSAPNPAFVAYGLGNFVWYNNQDAAAESGVLTLTVDASAARDATRRTGPVVVDQHWTPMLIGDDGVPRVPTSAATGARLAGAWDTATQCAGLEDQPG